MWIIPYIIMKMFVNDHEKMLKRLLYEIVNRIAMIHDLINKVNNRFEGILTDKQLHFLVIGILGMLLVLLIHPLFRRLARTNHVMVITWIYVFTLILVITFAVEIGQYMTNTGFESYQTLGDDGKPVDVGMMLDGHFTTNIDLAYNFKLPKLGLKEATVGVTLYNIFSAEYDNNGWAAPAYTRKDGRVVATGWAEKDQYEAGFATSAPFNMMAHLSVNF